MESREEEEPLTPPNSIVQERGTTRRDNSLHRLSELILRVFLNGPNLDLEVYSTANKITLIKEKRSSSSKQPSNLWLTFILPLFVAFLLGLLIQWCSSPIRSESFTFSVTTTTDYKLISPLERFLLESVLKRLGLFYLIAANLILLFVYYQSRYYNRINRYYIGGGILPTILAVLYYFEYYRRFIYFYQSIRDFFFAA